MAQFLKGTTTLGFHYKPKTPNDKGGVIMSVDSRASGGGFIGIFFIYFTTENLTNFS